MMCWCFFPASFLVDSHLTFNRTIIWLRYPYNWVDDNPILYGNAKSLDLRTSRYVFLVSKILLMEEILHQLIW